MLAAPYCLIIQAGKKIHRLRVKAKFGVFLRKKVEKIRKMQIQSQMTFNSQIEMRGQRSKKMIKVTQQKSVAIAVLSISKTNLVFN